MVFPGDDLLDDNPPKLDERAEIASQLREGGHDPMDIDSEQRVTFAWSILNSWEDEPPAQRGGRTDRDVALEAERVADRAAEFGIELEDPVAVDPEEDWL